MEPVRHILLRDRRAWLGALAGLTVDRDGALTLARVPGPADGKALEVAAGYPYVRELSGIATGPCDALFVSDTAHHRVLIVDGRCSAQAWIDGVSAPRGLALGTDALLVAAAAPARIQHFALPALEANLAWSGWTQPASVAVDAQGRVLVIDVAAKRLHRVAGNGSADAAFDAALAATGKLASPLFVAAGREDRVLVSDGAADQVFVFDHTGVYMHALQGPAGWLPGALASSAGRVYVADAANGAILVFDDSGVLHGTLPGYRGPVTAMAANAKGDLFIKPALDARYVTLSTDTAYLPQGRLEAGPFDAGELREWEWARIDAHTPAGTQCALQVAQLPAASPPPSPTDWHPLPSQDALLAPLLPNASANERRFLWLRLTLATGSPLATPRIEQVRAATPGESYLEHLPAIYTLSDQRPDGKEGFLSRLLKLVRSEWGVVEEHIDESSRLCDPDFVPASHLSWLAAWLGLELPQIAGDDERRKLIAQAVALFARRGTPASIAQWVELHTGIRPAIVEAFEQRAIWVLGECSRLDFETRLPPLDPNGMMLPDTQADPACCPGPIGRAVVGESGPLAAHQIGLPLFSEEAWRFCVVVDAYRAQQPATLEEIRRIVEREKPAHTDYRIELVEPDLRVGLQARVGIDAIVGGEPPPWRVAATVGFTTRLAPRDGATRVGETTLGDPTLTLS